MSAAKFRKYSLAIAESVDAWRIIPRVLLVAYGVFVWHLYTWFKSIPTFQQTQCDSGTLKVLLDSNLTMSEAKAIACTVIGIVGGPTTAQSALVTTVIGLSAGVFGLYVATGRRWEGGLPFDINRRFIYDAGEPSHYDNTRREPRYPSVPPETDYSVNSEYPPNQVTPTYSSIDQDYTDTGPKL